MSEATPQPTPATIAAAIGTLDAAGLRELAGRLVAELGRRQQAEVDDAEIKRRAGLLVAGAAEAQFGRVVCVFCGKLSSGDAALRRHIIRAHRDDVAELPAERFQRGAT
jgi:hypothetical protein